MEKEKIIFIINPISGAKKKVKMPDLIDTYLDKAKYYYEIVNTERAGHAAELTAEAIRSGVKKVIAVGGDGTINEVARVLVNTDCALGIIPCGSGNGLSRHLKVPLNHINAIKNINHNNVITIDSGVVNDKPFFCTSGVGFDAHIGKVFASSKIRGLNTYIRTTISEYFSYLPADYAFTINTQTVSKKAFLITFANSAQYGNNAYISPHADIQDGLLDLCILTPMPKRNLIPFGISIFRKTADKSKYLEIIKVREVVVERDSEGPVHLDGEPYEMGKILNVRINPASLKVLVP